MLVSMQLTIKQFEKYRIEKDNMTIKINFSKYSTVTDETLTQRFQFVYSPLNELLRSLHVLMNPRHHGLVIDWALKAIELLDEEDINSLYYFSPIYELGVPSTILCNFQYNTGNLENELSIVHSFLTKQDNINELINELITLKHERSNSFIPILAKGLEWQGFSFNQNSSLIKDLQSNPQPIIDRFINFIIKYNNNIFSTIWKKENIAKILFQEIKMCAKSINNHGIRFAINELQVDRMHWKKDSLIINKPFEREINLKDTDTIMLIPSFFIWPHLFVDTFKNGIVITYGLQRRDDIIYTPKELLSTFKALSDPTRLQILKTVSKSPCTTQGLSQLLSLSTSTVSRHLQILKDANLLQTTKQKKFVLYQITNRIFDLVPDFLRFTRGVSK